MHRNKTYQKKKTVILFFLCALLLTGLLGRLIYLCVFRSGYYSQKADDLHERERPIKAPRGEILDRNGTVLAANKTVCTISVIHSQIEEPEKVIALLTRELGISEEEVRKRVEKRSSMERVKTNVEKEIGDRIREAGLAGVKVDEDFKRYYPYGSLASHVLGFTGGDNQGVIGLEVEYEDTLKGQNGTILTLTDARGIEIDGEGESRIEPVPGHNLVTSLDLNLQKYCEQAAEKAMEEKQADSVSILLMNPQNGEIYAMANVPGFDLNDPFTLPATTDASALPEKEQQDLLNQMWRNPCLNDTYEPGSTFKIITMSAGLEEGVVKPEDSFFCPGYKVVEDRRIHCHKRIGHGSETFVKAAQNSCNPVFIEVGLRLGVDRFWNYFRQFGLMDRTGIDLPGEASTIMHKKENIGQVELATMAFGQSFQITPIRLAATVSSLINGGRTIVPHIGCEIREKGETTGTKLEGAAEKKVISEDTSRTVREILESVVSEGSGNKAYLEGYSIGGKTATSQTLPRSANRYISSFIGFAPARDPQILGLCIIRNPKGIYYGGTICAPVIRDIFSNALPYLGIEKEVSAEKTEE